MDLPYSHQLLGAAKTLAELQAMQERAGNLNRPMDRLGQHLVRKTVRILRSGERGVQARHASGLAGSIHHRTLFGSLFLSGNIYAGVQQAGGTLRSSRPGGYLAIPIADNLKAGGDPRFVSPLLVPDGFFFRSARGALLYARVLSKRVATRRKGYRGQARATLNRFSIESAKAELLFVGKKEVTVPAHHYCTFDAADKPRADGYMADWILRGR